MRIAITGAAGRVGRHVVDHAVAEGHHVLALDYAPRPEDLVAERYDCLDVTEYEALLTAIETCDALIHLAAITGPGLLPDHVVHDHNVVSSYHALRAAAEVGIRRVCQASSVNAIGGRFSNEPRYDYFPIDERHPTYAEDPYSLSKWVCEQQAEAMARRTPGMSIASLRLHGVLPDRDAAVAAFGSRDGVAERHLWGYVTFEAAARAFVLGVTVDLGGHEVFNVVAPDTMSASPSLDLAAAHYPDVPITGDLSGNRSFFDCAKAEALLGWSHDPRATTVEQTETPTPSSRQSEEAS